MITDWCGVRRARFAWGTRRRAHFSVPIVVVHGEEHARRVRRGVGRRREQSPARVLRLCGCLTRLHNAPLHQHERHSPSTNTDDKRPTRRENFPKIFAHCTPPHPTPLHFHFSSTAAAALSRVFRLLLLGAGAWVV
jgi:hypothetical protein